MSEKPLILVTNDDGIDSPGIYALVVALRKIGNVSVIAPDRQQSAVGHSLTVANPLRVVPFHRNGKMFGYAINGTPTDCVKLAVSNLLPKKPDLVVSGINHGQNTSINALYSGTVSAATEGMLVGINSIAVSISSHSLSVDLTSAAEFSLKLAKKLLKLKLPKGTLLNVNVPDLPKEQIKGVKVTRQSGSIWNDNYEKRTDPFGRQYYWFAGEFVKKDDVVNGDDEAVSQGYVSITPIHFKLTNEKALDELKFLEKL